jgi:hypothetical protein
MQNLWPWLFVLVCPLMMIFMMRGMGGGGGHGGHNPPPPDTHRDIDDERDRRIAELEREIVSLRKDDPAARDAVGHDAVGRDGSPR